MRLLLIPVFIFLAIILIAQKESKLKIIHADYNLGRKVNDKQLRILKGSVHIVKDTIQMYCDSAYYYEDVNRLELLSRVRIINGKRTIKSKKVIYFPDDDLIECLGNVRASSPQDSLFAHRLVYNLAKKEAITSGDIYLWSKTDKSYLTGQKGYFNEDDNYFRITENSHFVQIDSVSSDTFNIYSQILHYYGDDQNYALAIDCVQIVHSRTRQNCGTIYYESKRTKAFGSNWIEKFKSDIRERNANIGVLVTEVMPPDMDRLGLKDGIWICSFDEF